MSDPSLEAELAELVRTVAKTHSDVPITGASRFIEDLGVDSLDISMIIFSVMDKYDIEARRDDSPPIKGMADLLAYVSEHRKATAATARDVEDRKASDLEDGLEAGRPPLGSGLDAEALTPPLAEEVRERQHGTPEASPRPCAGDRGPRTAEARMQENGPVVCAAALPYARGMALLRWLTGRRWVLASLYRRQRTLLQRFLEALGSTDESEDIIGLSAISNLWGNWGLAALAVLPPPEFDRWVSVSGFATFEDAHRQGRGVILLLAHLPGHMLPPLLLARRAYPDIIIVGMASSQLQAMGLGHLKRALLADEEVWRGDRDHRFASQMAAGRQALARGGIVLIAADGQMGSRLQPMPFHGRRRPFGIGFAELAAATGAKVVPVFTRLNASGKVDIQFHKWLTAVDPEASREESVADLVRQYAVLLQDAWTEVPGNIAWHSIRKFLGFPSS